MNGLFLLNTPLESEEEKWMLGMAGLEVYNQISDITKRNNVFAI